MVSRFLYYLAVFVKIAILFFMGRWIRPSADGPGRRENVHPARFLTRLPFESIFTKSHTQQEAPSVRMVLLAGGGRWIRTIEGIASRFTVCPLWPLGNSPICNCRTVKRMFCGGAGGRIRTPDLLITNQLLYRLSYTSVSVQPAYNSKYRPICQ